jgi:multidrug efflux pump subunit AcrA (membrane-fusion protein)
MPAPLTTPAADRLDVPVRLLPARLWAGFAALALVVVAAAVWGTVATLPQHVSATGVILHGRSAVTVRATEAGSLSSLSVTPGTTVHRGRLLGTLTSDGVQVAVRAPVDGTVMSVLAAPGRRLEPGAALVAIDAVARPARAVLVVISPRTLARLAPGQHVDVAGAGDGRVSSVTPYPASEVDLVSRFGTTEVPGIARDGKSTWLVDVALDEPLAQGVPALTPVRASVLVDRVRPYRLVFGGTR